MAFIVSSQNALAEYKSTQIISNDTNFYQSVINPSDFQLMPLIANFANAQLSAFNQIQNSPESTENKSGLGLTWLFAIAISLFGIGRGINL